jgi:glutamate-ammonia-ligase adenylyltransferase
MTDAAPMAEIGARLPDPLVAGVARHWDDLTATAPALAQRIQADEARLGSLIRVWAASDFVARSCTRAPDMLAELIESGDLDRAYPTDALMRRLTAVAEAADAQGTLAVALRGTRLREMVRIAWRDLAGVADLAETLRELSWLADACVDAALGRLHVWEVARRGEPLGPRGEAQSLVVLGMGKLGGLELNFSSDIDLIFAYPDKGETNGRRPVSNEEFFRALGQRLIKVLGEATAEGFVFRVDMRLRPFGDAGPLVTHFDALEHYYQTHGREWERYAMIKARPIAGDRAAGEALMRRLRPFVYRRYLDYGAFASLREMKGLIAREVERKGLRRNVKLGPGGIREIEFVGQAFQLIYGGRLPALQARGISDVLDQLAAEEIMPAYAVAQLQEAYGFLRRTENRLQAFDDRQTHDLPTDDLAKVRLAFAMGFDDWGGLVRALMNHVRRVEEQFQQVFAAPQSDEGDAANLGWVGIWAGSGSDAAALAHFQDGGFADGEAALQRVQRLRGSRTCRALTKNGRERLNALIPLLLGAVAGSDNPDETLERVLRLVESVARRSVYLALLVENPLALSQLVRLCSASAWIAEYLGKHPLLLDDLLTPGTLYEPLQPDALAGELEVFLSRVQEDDLEQQMDVLRHFQQTNMLRVAAADVTGGMRLMVVSDCLTWIAETVIRRVLDIAWREVTRKHGEPWCELDGRRTRPGFAVVAYGKLGGIELGYGSDLDLVFLHDSRGRNQMTDGPRPLDNPSFFVRLAQRIIHIIGTLTPAGVLYEVDTRLRPSGRSGLLVTSLQAFAEYQRSDAWTWEHQALVRARAVAGPEAMVDAFEAVRREILSRPRDLDALRIEVREMRERMRTELGARTPGCFDLKQDPGGIADIEFMVQYAVLAGAREHPELLVWSDNIRQLDALEQSGLMATEDATLLRDTYRALRRLGHLATLRGLRTAFPEEAIDESLMTARRQVRALWARFMESGPGAETAV